MRTRLATASIRLVADDPSAAIVLSDISVDYFTEAAACFPDRVVNVGIMEQTLVGVAAGFAMEGFHPIMHSIAPFLVERPYEQLKLDFGYQGLGGTLASIGASYDYGTEGATHHSPGDVGAMLQIPGTEILVPGTPAELESLLRATYANGALTYLRSSISTNSQTFPVGPGSVHVLRTGSRATVLAFGPMLRPTLAACEGLDVSACYSASLSPLNPDDLRKAIGQTEAVITVEPWHQGTSHSVITDALSGTPHSFFSIGVPRTYRRRYGTAEEHDIDIGLDALGIRQRLVQSLGI